MTNQNDNLISMETKGRFDIVLLFEGRVDDRLTPVGGLEGGPVLALLLPVAVHGAHRVVGLEIQD